MHKKNSGYFVRRFQPRYLNRKNVENENFSGTSQLPEKTIHGKTEKDERRSPQLTTFFKKFLLLTPSGYVETNPGSYKKQKQLATKFVPRKSKICSFVLSKCN